MSNIIDANGITVLTYTEVVNAITTSLEAIYGTDINTASDTPDGQNIGIFAQAAIDLEDLLVQIYSSFDPDQATGVVLDQRVSINGIQRIAGTYTLTPVSVVVDRSLNLVGLDSTDIDQLLGTEFIVSDSQNNKFILVSSTTLAGAGTYSLTFQSIVDGAVQTVLNTLTTPITVVLGVTSVNNPAAATSVGLDEETDAALRLRRQQSVSLASQGYMASLRAELLNISGVTYAKIYENNTGATDVDGIPSHSIWVIVEGGDSDDIAYAIYTKRNAGCGMKGNELVNVTQVDATLFEIKFDRTTVEDLYVKFNATSIDGVSSISTTYLMTGIAADIAPDVNESITINQIACLVQALDTNCLATEIYVSADNSTWLSIVDNTAKNYRFSLSSANVFITVI